ncbi:hypothetical protein [Calothrix sp. PCC 6303]|nr:hypothetical protein [Calothrix sp. PCC 6303]
MFESAITLSFEYFFGSAIAWLNKAVFNDCVMAIAIYSDRESC